MNIKPGFVLRPLGNEYILLGESVEQVNFNKMLRFNDTAAYLWKRLEGRDFTTSDMADLLCEEYEVTKEQALTDAEALLQSWKDLDVVE